MNNKQYTKADLLEREMKNLKEVNSNEHKDILSEISLINQKLDELFVTKTEFCPVRNIVYGLVGLILVGAISAILNLIFIK